MAPLPGLEDKIAVTAWTHLMTCPAFTEEAFDEFTESYRFQGPERFSRRRVAARDELSVALIRDAGVAER